MNFRFLLTMMSIGTLTLPGCDGGSEYYPVIGIVQLGKDNPLVGGRVSFEAKDLSRSASGIVDPQGRFILNAPGKRDGVSPGAYRVVVAPAGPTNDRSLAPQTVPAWCRSYETSGLEVIVERGPNEFEITLGKDAGRVVRRTSDAEH